MTFGGWDMGWAWVWMLGGTILTVVVIVPGGLGRDQCAAARTRDARAAGGTGDGA